MDRDMPNRPNSQISFSIAPGPFSDYFELPLTTKSDIAMARLVHYDTFSSCNLTIIAQVNSISNLIYVIKVLFFSIIYILKFGSANCQLINSVQKLV